MVPSFFPESRRGDERTADELARGLLALGHRADVLTAHPGAPSRTVEEGGLRVVRQWRPPEGQLLRRGFEKHMTHMPMTYLSLAAGSYDVAQALHVTDAAVAARWTRRAGRPSVFSHLGLPDRPSLTSRRMRLKLTLEAVHGCSAVVALSRTAAAALRHWLGVEARVIHPPVDVEALTPGPEERAEHPTVLCAADADDPRKRVDLLVAAFRRVRRDLPEARLVLVRPPDPGRAARLAEAVEGVELVEAVDLSAELAPAYRRAWVSVLPSVDEPFGLVLAEAMACGTPVVGTRSGSIPELIDRESVGVMFEGGEESLASALLEALELSRAEGTPAACRARAEELSTERCAREYEDLYLELLRP